MRRIPLIERFFLFPLLELWPGYICIWKGRLWKNFAPATEGFPSFDQIAGETPPSSCGPLFPGHPQPTDTAIVFLLVYRGSSVVPPLTFTAFSFQLPFPPSLLRMLLSFRSLWEYAWPSPLPAPLPFPRGGAPFSGRVPIGYLSTGAARCRNIRRKKK